MSANQYDTIIRGGDVCDPGAGLVGKLDIAIKGGKIAAVEANLDPASASKVINATGHIVTPGLIDLHTHVYWGVTYWGIEPDPVTARSGVTTWLDVGSAGAYNWPAFRRWVAEPATSRIYALLNLSSIGLTAPTWELSNIDYCDVPLAESIVEANRDLILGIKARIDPLTTRGTGIRPLELARELADRVNLPLMVHIGGTPPTLEEILPLIKPGDIITHCFTGQPNRIVTDGGLPREDVIKLHAAGVILDIGHGAGSFSFETAEKMLAAGIMPDVISTDIHQLAIQGPCFDMPTTMSKFLSLGMSLEDVIDRTTRTAASAMRRPDLGTLKTGSLADIACFQLEEGNYTFQDIHMNERKAGSRLVNTLTMIGGDVLQIEDEKPLQPWAKLNDNQRNNMIQQPPTAVKRIEA